MQQRLKSITMQANHKYACDQPAAATYQKELEVC